MVAPVTHEMRRNMNLKRLSVALVALVFGALNMALAVDGPVLVFGGTSGTGLGAVQSLRGMDVAVTVFVRPTSDLSSLESLGVSTVVGNALNADQVTAAFAAGEFTAVISSLGGRRGEPRPDLIGNQNITAAAKQAGVGRIVQISSMGVGDSREPPGEGEGFMAQVLYFKTLAEDDLIASGLNYTIIRPGGLRRGEATGTGVLKDYEKMGAIDRQELGRLVAKILDDAGTYRQVLYAWDPALPVPEEE
jgi:uncharacterized protein YbjT (DUF2867 family)